MNKGMTKFLVITIAAMLLLPNIVTKAADLPTISEARIAYSPQDLQTLVNTVCDAIGNDNPMRSLYTPATLRDLRTACDAAMEVCDSSMFTTGGEASNGTLDAIESLTESVYENLKDAWNRRKTYADVLGELIVLQYNSDGTLVLNRSNYTSGSWAKYASAVENAKQEWAYGLSLNPDVMGDESGRLPMGYPEKFETAILNLIYSRCALVPADLTTSIDEQYTCIARTNLKLLPAQYSAASWKEYTERLTEAEVVEGGDGYYVNDEFRFLPLKSIATYLSYSTPSDILSSLKTGFESISPTDDSTTSNEISEISNIANKIASISLVRTIETLPTKIIPVQAIEQALGMCNGKVYCDIAKSNLDKAAAKLVKVDGNYLIHVPKLVVHESGDSRRSMIYKLGMKVYVSDIHKNKNGIEIGYITVGSGKKAWKGVVEMKSLMWAVPSEN